jgi:hypothetical protein
VPGKNFAVKNAGFRLNKGLDFVEDRLVGFGVIIAVASEGFRV